MAVDRIAQRRKRRLYNGHVLTPYAHGCSLQPTDLQFDEIFIWAIVSNVEATIIHKFHRNGNLMMSVRARQRFKLNVDFLSTCNVCFSTSDYRYFEAFAMFKELHFHWIGTQEFGIYLEHSSLLPTAHTLDGCAENKPVGEIRWFIFNHISVSGDCWEVEDCSTSTF